MRNPALYRSTLLSLLLTIPVGAVTAGAQQNVAVPAAPGKAFDVVSIRQNIEEGPRKEPENLAPTPDGFHLVRAPLIAVLLTAYTPQGSNGGLFINTIENLPDWAERENYDIDARISDADRAAWNDPKNQPAMLQQMLQAMLTDRFKLVVHRATKEVPVYDLAVTKGGPKFSETKPDERRQAGIALPGGGMMEPVNTPGFRGAHFYNFTMGMLASVLGEKSDRPVLDKTGLTGRYDIDIRTPEPMAAPSASPGSTQENDPQPAIFDVLKELGLKLEPAKGQVKTLVIDHIERPTKN